MKRRKMKTTTTTPDEHAKSEHSNTNNKLNQRGSGPQPMARPVKLRAQLSQLDEAYDERQQFLIGSSGKGRLAKLARQESELDDDMASQKRPGLNGSRAWRPLLVLLLVALTCVVAIYCIPFLEFEPRVPRRLPLIPFNYRQGPLQASSASSVTYERLFEGQIYGAESVALDSMGNMYLAIEGGFILFARLNASAPLDRSYYLAGDASLTADSVALERLPKLVKIAELNPIKQMSGSQGGRRTGRQQQDSAASSSSWRRECQLDEQVYGSQLYQGGPPVAGQRPPEAGAGLANFSEFRSNVRISRCSKPLGVRLSPDEKHLYVVDTLSGLYKVNLRVAERPHSNQRLVSRLIDFRQPMRLPIWTAQEANEAPKKRQSPSEETSSPPPPLTAASSGPFSPGQLVNVTLRAVDDLAIDWGAGQRGADVIYLSVASQHWLAISYVYELLEGRSSSLILRLDTGSAGPASVLDPTRMSNVRQSTLELVDTNSRLYASGGELETGELAGVGAPQLNENDVFDERPLSFANGLELTADRQALLIADTSNRRIVKHFIRGPRRGATDLWAWTPNMPDNIRRGIGRSADSETYWVVGCGKQPGAAPDLLVWLRAWPRLRKYLAKNLYLMGWLIEALGKNILLSTSVRDYGYSMRTGASFCEQFCPGMMLLQYGKNGHLLRSLYSHEFPNDLVYYSQANEQFDARSQQHVLYLSSPSYSYITRLVLPADSWPTGLD